MDRSLEPCQRKVLNTVNKQFGTNGNASNISPSSGNLSASFTAHIDSPWANNPIGALLHWKTDVLGHATRDDPGGNVVAPPLIIAKSPVVSPSFHSKITILDARLDTELRAATHSKAAPAWLRLDAALTDRRAALWFSAFGTPLGSVAEWSGPASEELRDVYSSLHGRPWSR
jgi:hypothetical protein